MADAQLNFIMEKIGPGDYVLYACRGDGKGCQRNKFRERKKHCENCFGPCPEDWMLEQVRAHITKGDA